MPVTDDRLKYKPAWLLLGYLMIALIVQQTLTASPMTAGMHFPDKFLHAFGYFVLMGWFVQIYRRPRAKIICGLSFVVMGVVLEFLQGLGGIRHYEINDMLANGLGVVIAWLLSSTRFSSGVYMFERWLASMQD